MPPLILQVTETATGGVGRHLRDLLTGLDPARFRQVAIVSYDRTPPGWEEGLPWPVRRIELRRNLHPRADLRAYRELLAVMRELQPDLVHAHSSKAGFLARRAGWKLGLPVIYTPHVFAFQASACPLRRRLYMCLERRAARWGRTIIAVSEAERREALERLHCAPEQVALIPNGVRAEDYRHLPGRSYRTLLGLSEEAEVLLAAGELRPQKDYSLLLRALALLDRPRLRCLIAGAEAGRSALRRLRRQLGLADRVSFLGDRRDVPALLGAADALVMSSRYEGCPYVLLEALAAGTPVVAVSAPGVDELVTAETGQLAADRRPESLAACLEEVLDDRRAAQERAARAQERLAREFVLDRMLAGTAAVYEQCLHAST